MPDVITSNNMGLTIPIATQTTGPDWANDINSCFLIIDSHNHSSGSGVPITPSGLNINADLSFQSNNATVLRTARFVSQASPIASTSPDIGCLYVSGTDLYYNDRDSHQIQITSGGGVAGTPGSISNLTSPASASYVAADSTFVWQSDVDSAANMDCGAITIRSIGAGLNGVTIDVYSGTAVYTMLLPTALPSSQKIVTLDNSGNLTAPYSLDGTTITTTSNVIGLRNPISIDVNFGAAVNVAGTLAATGLSSAATIEAASHVVDVSTVGGASNTIKASSATLLQSYPTSLGSSVALGFVLSANPSASNLKVVRGVVAANSSTPIAGEGFTVVHNSAGKYTVTFSTAFAVDSQPIILVCSEAEVSTNTPRHACVLAGTAATTGFQVQVTNLSGTLTDNIWNFIAIGQWHS